MSLENDNACDAINLSLDTPSLGDAHSLAGATSQRGEPSTNFNNIGGPVWFKFVAPANGNIQIITDIFGGTLNDSEIAVYSVIDCNDFLIYNQLGFNQDGGAVAGTDVWMSMLNRYGLHPAEIYYIQVDR